MNIQQSINKEVIDNIKNKLSNKYGNGEDVTDSEWRIITFLLDNDRDFIIAPDYNFSLNDMLDSIERGLTIEEICKAMNCGPKSIYSIQKKIVKKIYKNLGKTTKDLKKYENTDINNVIKEVIRKRGRPRKEKGSMRQLEFLN